MQKDTRQIVIFNGYLILTIINYSALLFINLFGLTQKSFYIFEKYYPYVSNFWLLLTVVALIYFLKQKTNRIILWIPILYFLNSVVNLIFTMVLDLKNGSVLVDTSSALVRAYLNYGRIFLIYILLFSVVLFLKQFFAKSK